MASSSSSSSSSTAAFGGTFGGTETPWGATADLDAFDDLDDLAWDTAWDLGDFPVTLDERFALAQVCLDTEEERSAVDARVVAAAENANAVAVVATNEVAATVLAKNGNATEHEEAGADIFDMGLDAHELAARIFDDDANPCAGVHEGAGAAAAAEANPPNANTLASATPTRPTNTAYLYPSLNLQARRARPSRDAGPSHHASPPSLLRTRSPSPCPTLDYAQSHTSSDSSSSGSSSASPYSETAARLAHEANERRGAEPQHKCANCGAAFPVPRGLNDHLRRGTCEKSIDERRIHPCPFCPTPSTSFSKKFFCSAKVRFDHIKTMHVDRAHEVADPVDAKRRCSEQELQNFHPNPTHPLGTWYEGDVGALAGGTVELTRARHIEALKRYMQGDRRPRAPPAPPAPARKRKGAPQRMRARRGSDSADESDGDAASLSLYSAFGGGADALGAEAASVASSWAAAAAAAAERAAVPAKTASKRARLGSSDW